MKEYFHNIINYFEELKEVGLAILAFIESSFSPIPPDLLLIAMSLSIPEKALLFALICTLFSTLGGALGYTIGKFGGRPVFNWLFKKKAHYFEKVEKLYIGY
jgi:undecaprenyl-diphosphatase